MRIRSSRFLGSWGSAFLLLYVCYMYIFFSCIKLCRLFFMRYDIPRLAGVR